MPSSFHRDGRPNLNDKADKIENTITEIGGNPAGPTAESISSISGGNPMSSERIIHEPAKIDEAGDPKQQPIGQDIIITGAINPDEATNPAAPIISPRRIEEIGDPIEGRIDRHARSGLPADSGDTDGAGDEDGIGHEENP